jgi:ATP-dependent Clp protease protease subunit
MKLILKRSKKDADDDHDNDVDKSKIESDIYRDNNHIYFYTEIDRSSILKLNTLLREAEEYCIITSLKLRIETIPIYLHIYSSGGYIYSAFSCIDVIQSSKAPVYSVIEGATASAGTLISVVCEKRYIRPTAYMLIHQLSSECWGKMSEIADEFQNLTDLMNKITDIYVEYSKIPRTKLKSLLEHDLWLDAKKSISYGLADEIY